VKPPKRSAFLDQFCRQLVHAAGEIAGGGIIAHMDARRADGCYRNVDPGVIHVRQRGLFRPRRGHNAADRAVRVVRCAPEDLGKNVVVNVNGEGHAHPPSLLGGLDQFSSAAADHV
jgi:hypothetical protein